jgi:hypothetical protein
MRPGTKNREYDKELASILVQRGEDKKKVEFTTDDLVYFDSVETIFLDTLQRAEDVGKIKVSSKIALFDLNASDYINGAPVIAVAEKVKREHRRRLAVEWKNPVVIGRFKYCKNGVDDVLVKMDNEPFTTGPDADKIIVALLESLDVPLSKTALASCSGTTESGLKQMIYRINREYCDVTMKDEKLVLFEKGYVIKSE